MFIDTHAHLFYPNFNEDIDEVILKIKNAGVDFVIVPATDIPTSYQTIELCEKYDFVYGTVGVHPHETKNWDDSFLTEIENLSKHKKIVGIGEIGLDYYYDFSPKEKQIQAFKSQINLALKLNLPIVVHNRESDEDIMQIIREFKSTPLKAQFHCFNGSLENAKELIQMNHFISFVGNITFKKADALRNIVSNVNLNNVMIETDSPFMTPVPFRGKRNDPSNVKYIAQQIAELHNKSIEEIARITSNNAINFFKLTDNKNNK